MNLSHLSVIFIIIIIPIILVTSYYISLQVDTANMQTDYNSKLLNATKTAIEAFEINTVEWNSSYSETADSKRRDIMASINTFTTSFANSLGVSGTSQEDILTYVPAIAYTLYDGYYIYAPSETKEVIKDSNGVAVLMSYDLVNGEGSLISGYDYQAKDEGKILYVPAEGKASDGTYNGQSFTLDSDYAATTYEHILKPFSSYSENYSEGSTNIIINYTLDNYIKVYGEVNGTYENRAGYLVNTDEIEPTSGSTEVKFNGKEIKPETLTETIWYEGIKDDIPQEFTYIYASDNTKVYFDGDTPFQVGSTNKRTDLSDTNSVKYKKLSIYNGTNEYYEVFQALNNSKNGNIEKGKWYKSTDTKNPEEATNINIKINIYEDVSAINYYVESYCFTKWVYNNLGNINVVEKDEDGNVTSSVWLFTKDDKGDPAGEGSIFTNHKREVIKQALISDLNEAITAYSRNSEGGEYWLPVLTEDDWNQILRNVSMTTFVQGIPIGTKDYNNYSVVTSTANKEYVNPDEIYLNDVNDTDTNTDTYYHLPGCSKLTSDNIIGYRNIDYKIKTYTKDNTTYYYYMHNIDDSTTRQECYYCLVQRSLYEETDDSNLEIQEHAYNQALARERYNNRQTKM